MVGRFDEFRCRDGGFDLRDGVDESADAGDEDPADSAGGESEAAPGCTGQDHVTGVQGHDRGEIDEHFGDTAGETLRAGLGARFVIAAE